MGTALKAKRLPVIRRGQAQAAVVGVFSPCDPRIDKGSEAEIHRRYRSALAFDTFNYR